MAESAAKTPVAGSDPAAARAPDTAGSGRDLSGQDRITWNVLTSWAGYGVEIVTGFIVPRLMDRHLGQTVLGVWDFSWSCVSYFRLAQIGVAQATSRYLARHRAMRDVEGVNRVASSTLGVSMGVASLVLTMTALVVWCVPVFFSARLADQVATAQWVVGLLGAGLAFNYLFEVFSGILTGSHRWDLHNALIAGSQFLISAAMITVLSFGGGLREIALAHTGGVVLGELMRMWVAYRICPELRIRPSYWSLEQARRMLSFGAKSSVSAIAWLMLVQTNNLIIVSQLGPAALALYARPNALLRIPENLVRKVAFVIAPIASSLQGAGRHEEIRHLALKGTRSAASLVIPMTLGLVTLGGPLLHVWMGPGYDQGLVLAILALGMAPVLAQRPVVAVLAGLNLHGFVARMNVFAATLGVGLSLLNVKVIGLGLVGGALAVVTPMILTTVFIIPAYASRRLSIPLHEYMREGYGLPLACSVPFGLVLLASRMIFNDRPLPAVVFGSLAGGLVLAPLYWRFLAPAQVREWVRGLLPEALARRLPPARA